ncbi:MAG: hypothetical protein CMN78_04295 [Spirochaetales bacterium]|nr:hypothetical protein [Spirochaetales bacterium]
MLHMKHDDTWHIEPLAQSYTVVYESPDPATIFCYSPGILVLDSKFGGAKCRRLIATIDVSGPGAKKLPGKKGYRARKDGSAWQGKIFSSDDGGASWRHKADFPFLHARPFAAGDAVYVLGQADDLMVIRSGDGGETWGEPVALTGGEQWHQAPCNVHYANGCVYLAMEKRTREVVKGWPVGDMAPVLMRGPIWDDLTRRDSWTFASELPYYEAMKNVEHDGDIEYVGIPFFSTDYPEPRRLCEGRSSNPMGWLETNVIQFVDPDHYWHDPAGKTFHLWARAQTDRTGYACVAKVLEQGEDPGTGAMETTLEQVPSGKTCLYVPCPGGQMKFHVLYDEESKLYWLLSSQAVDSMRKVETLPQNRYGLPYNQRRRLQLHFSRNMIDWCFACLVAIGPRENASRHYASMAIDGEDLYILSRSGDERARSAHDGNIITFHTIRDFRRLIY